MEYKITDLLAAAFDIKIPIRIPDLATIAKDKLGQHYTIKEDKQNAGDIYYPKVKRKNQIDGSLYLSWMGTPILYPFTFKGGKYKQYKKNGELEEIMMDDFVLPSATIVDFTRAKNIISTEMMAGNGTVKELFGFDDWKIRIRGFCLDDSNRAAFKTAQEQKKQLLMWERLCSGIEVRGELLWEKGIEEIVIESIGIRQLEGKPGVMPFEISASSNEPISLAG